MWRRFARRYREAKMGEYQWRPNADRYGIDNLLERCGEDVGEVCERIDAAFKRQSKPASLSALAHEEHRREFGSAVAS